MGTARGETVNKPFYNRHFMMMRRLRAKQRPLRAAAKPPPLESKVAALESKVAVANAAALESKVASKPPCSAETMTTTGRVCRRGRALNDDVIASPI